MEGDAPDDEFRDVMERYARSCDDMRTLRLNPVKAIPADQWLGGPGGQGSAGKRVPSRSSYARYVRKVAEQNERLVGQARGWWVWWEAAQTDPSKAGIEPLLDPLIEGGLRMAAVQRGQEFERQVAARAQLALAISQAIDESKAKSNSKDSVYGRLAVAIHKLLKRRDFGATQDQVAKAANCNSRTLRRGRGAELWKAYRAAGVRVQHTEDPRPAKSRYGRTAGEKFRSKSLVPDG